ncbi:cobalt-precorrin-6A reductase [Roseovarius autotrophicus]|uniref:cobalt-precorrin-6A reductase n=1 Tax=Roseovarius autotrophicus TaxID=2824121 RepID=UPI001A0C97F2|nr:cobalt-precorrin-6A reductase [Roseovarius autotrophicus]MBE0453091.1 cobalt-precorrin-6A reductase [Roseovarius sp.]
MPHILVLGGTTEASLLAQRLAEARLPATLSYAGRVARLRSQPVPVRVGGFGGVAGLTDHLRRERVTHLVDATHPFAATMSGNAIAACAATGVPLLALTRPAWQPEQGDDWRHMPDIPAAVAALAGPPRRVMLAIGRMHLDAFAAQPQHSYLLRLVDPPEVAPPLPDCHVIVDRGPFTVAGDTALMRAHGIDLIVSKNAGGSGAEAKLAAARALGLPVMMIGRPPLPDRAEVHSVDEVLRWLHGADLGV